ncbi:MAG: NAD(P)H-hydrate dehydratase [Chlorobi bacterium]|nr:NAD(P)H-hydrate dehydratase [Chlorobiota bacterium]
MIKIFSVKQVPLIDKYTIENEPVLSINLMERAAGTLFEWIQNNYPDKCVKVFAGPGNNGGDALALARMLFQAKHDVVIYIVNPSGKFSPDARANLDKLLKIISENKVVYLSDDNTGFPDLAAEDLIVDGLFGSGLNRPLRGLPLKVVKHINNSEATVLSVDIPSGLFGEDNSNNDPEGIVRADHTLSFQFPKLSFLLADYGEFAGDWEIMDIGLHPEAVEEYETKRFFIETDDIASLIKTRNRFSHKGDYGHALLLAGSYGKMGAAVLASKGCLKSGAGLLTSHIPHYGYQIIQTSVPEAMTSIDRSDILISEFPGPEPFNAIGVGPGIGTKPNTVKAVKELIQAAAQKTLVLDADALNIISENKELLNLLPENTVLTPHPKEFDRLAGISTSHYERLEKAVEFAGEYKVIVVLKGAYTVTVLPDGNCYFNSTGNPGMATAGSGDVLTGVILGLLAQKYLPHEAAVIGVYVHGLAGDIAAAEESEQGVTASAIINNLGRAFSAF